jgi:hypothetical protein
MMPPPRVCRIPWLAVALLAGLPSAAAGGVLKGPYLVDMTPRSVKVRFESDTLLQSEVRFWPEGHASRARTFVFTPTAFRVDVVFASAESPKKTITREEERYLYEAELLDLSPGTAHRYLVRHGSREAEEGRFRTFGLDADRTVFLAFGDVRTGHENHRALVKLFRAQDPDFLTIAGDLVVDGKVYANWQKFFDIEGHFLRDVPLFPSWGNHEGRVGLFDRYFPFPLRFQNRYYPFPRRTFNRSFDCGPVHVLLIDSGAEPTPEELDWIDRDLSAAASRPWKIAVYHHPSYNEGGHGSSFGLPRLVPLFKKHQLDLTLTGHSHLYERAHPLKSRFKDEKPILHVICGGGGAPLAQDRDAFYLAARKKAYHFLRIEADREKLVGTALGIDGRPFDSFILRRSPLGPPAVSPAAVASLSAVAPVTASAPLDGAEASSPALAVPAPEKVVAEELVTLWRGLRGLFDTGLRYRLPEAKPPAPGTGTPAASAPEEPIPPLPWVFKVPDCPLGGEVDVEVRLSHLDADHWEMVPPAARFRWRTRDLRLFWIRPRDGPALARKLPPRLEVRLESPFGGFFQETPLRMTFATEGRSTRRTRI